MLVRTVFARALLGALVGLAADANAVVFDYTVEAAIEHSDNIARSAIDEQSQNVLIPRASFSLTEEGADVQAKATGAFEYRDYLGNAFGNELRGQMSGRVNWIALPERLHFTVEDYLSVQPVNILATNAPSNQQQTNVLGLGPTFYFRLGPTFKGEAELRYVDSIAQKTKEFDSQRLGGAFRAIKDLNPTDQISGNVEAQHVTFQKTGVGPDYDRYDAYGRYVSKLASLDLDLALGYSSLDFDGASSRSGALARGTLAWRASERSTLTATLLRGFADAAQDLAQQAGFTSGIPFVATGNTVVTSQVYLERRLDVGYGYVGERWRGNVNTFYRKLGYELDPTLDQTGHGGYADIGYRLTPLRTLGFVAAEETRQFDGFNRHDEDLAYGVYLLSELTRNWSWRIDLDRNQRTSNAADQRYTENVFYFTVSYRR